MKKMFSSSLNMSPQARNAFQIAIGISAAHFMAVTYYAYLMYSGQITAFERFLTLTVVSAALGVVFGIAALLSRRGQHILGGILLLGTLALAYPPIATLVTGLGTILGTALVFVGPMSAFQVLPRKSGWVMTVLTVVSGLATLLVDVFGSSERPSLPGVFIPLLAATVVGVLGFIVVRQFRDYSLQTKFLVSILVTTGLSVTVFVLFAVYSFGQSQTFMVDQLQTTVRSQSKLQLNSTTLAEAGNAEEVLSKIAEEVGKLAEYQGALYAQSSILGEGAYWDAGTRLTMRSGGQYGNSKSDPASVVVPSTVSLDEAMIADINTNIYLDFTAPAILQSNPNVAAVYFVGTNGISIYYPNINLSEVTPPDFDPRDQSFYTVATPKNNPERKVVWTEPYQDPAGQGLLVTSVTPVYDQAGKFKGVIAADVRLADITGTISKVKVGQSGFAFLIDSSGHIIGMPSAGYEMFSLSPEVVPVNETPKQTILSAGTQELQDVFRKMIAGETGLGTVSIQGRQFYLSYAPLSSVNYSLGVVAPVVELDAPYLTARDQIARGTQTSVRLATIILIVVLIAAAGISLLLSQFLSRPIMRLTHVAEQVAAGDLAAQAKVESADETGVLADAFNRMTTQLRDFIGTLETRVADRTRNIELAAEVGRIVSQVRALDIMLKEAAELIRSRFDLYYVQVYLIDSTRASLVLRSGTGTVGAKLLNSNHKLPLNITSINGRAAIEKRSMVVADTAASSTFKPNPLLPYTRSEMAVPLLVGEKVVGVLDMQSEHVGSLSQETLPAFEVLAGQLAIAIQNASLLEETENARAEVERQARRSVRRNWSEYLDAIHTPESLGFVFEGNQVSTITSAEAAQPRQPEKTVTVPITVTGEPLGKLVVESENQSPEEVKLVHAVALQVAQQIENLRIIESAERYRAEAEQASRRLTREGWKDFMEDKAEEGLGFLYDTNRIQPARNVEVDEGQGLILPLKVRDEPVGKMVIQGVEPEDQEVRELADAVAERLSTHIENLRLSGQIEKRAHHERILQEVTSRVSSSVTVETAMRRAVEEVGRLMGRKAFIKLIEKETSDKGSVSQEDAQ